MTRLWVDTNVLLRFLTGEPEDLAEQAARLMSRAERGEIVLFVSSLVIAEPVCSFDGDFKRLPAQRVVPS